ncbi:hypothetical protein EZS27_035054 [termite gut metagenome]|uniref:Uncharacterized protein n=1 Tax=termite gut metagenome TaxID=433724 RepID=A0A5J4PXC2_9ZZZZ
MIKENRRKFYEFPPLRYYISTTTAKNARYNLSLDVRYRGQSVATLKATNNVTISTKGKSAKNLRDFNCDIELNDVDWKGVDVREFRRFFKNRANSRNNNKNKKMKSIVLKVYCYQSFQRQAVEINRYLTSNQ